MSKVITGRVEQKFQVSEVDNRSLSLTVIFLAGADGQSVPYAKQTNNEVHDVEVGACIQVTLLQGGYVDLGDGTQVPLVSTIENAL